MGRRRSRLAQALAFAPAAIALGTARLLPWRARLAFGAFAGRCLALGLPRFRRRIEANLAYIMPELGPQERVRIAQETGDNFGRTFMEIFDLAGFRARNLWLGPEGPGVEAARAALRAGKGAIFVTGHFGQWEAGRAWLSAEGVNVAGLYRPLNNAPLDRIYVRNLKAGGTPMFPKTSRGLRGLVAHVARGGVVAILTDQYERRAMLLPFMGKPAPTPTFAASLALKYGVPLIPAYGLRDRDGQHLRVIVEEPIPTGTAEAMTQALNDSLSAQIRARPGQYFWLHLRWRKDLPDLRR